MKNITKKIMSIVLSMVMMLAMSVMTLADGTGSIIINAADGITFGDATTFTAYKVMDYTSVTSDTGIYSVTASFAPYFASLNPALTTDEEIYAYLSDSNTDIKEVGNAVFTWMKDNEVTGTTGSITDNGASYTISGLDNGYYFVYQTGTDEGGNTSAVIIQTLAVEVQGEVIVTQKTSVPVLNKEVQDDDDSWGSVTDKGIGDTVNFRTNTTIPDVSSFTNYEYIIHDTMSNGLSFNGDIVVTATGDGKDAKTLLETDYTVSTENTDGCTFEITFTKDTLLALYKEGYRSLVTTYSAVLNENALASTSNGLSAYTNSAKLTYTNVSDGSTTTDTPEDVTYVYTFKLDATKVNANGSPLAGAQFQLYAGDVLVELLYNATLDAYMVKGAGVSEGGWVACNNTITTLATGKIEIIGLDDAITYTLKESAAPEGYVAANDITFTIDADYDNSSSALTSLTTENTSVTGDVADGAVNAGQIVNIAESILPSTGGIGTTVFYVVGVVLMAGAVTLLVLKKRRNVEEA